MKRRRIKPAETVSIAFTARERLLVLDHTFAGGEVIEPLEAARQTRGRCVVKYTLDDLDELPGYVAAEANHSKSKKIQAELDALYHRLQTEMQAYDDGLWQGRASLWARQRSRQAARNLSMTLRHQGRRNYCAAV